ncbi:TfoX/Sxy family DNA transformation protein [Listeria kieliensis]|uniref:Competence protein TfoX n=1 Tax=Listeria kieliensis TaxID=1621700 RepID=A0A3D8TT16_9LIST|nr:TfoX/Sxy family DNA transformation protein [Listeria kieliensis]RDX02103.1 competence protein TfoX [Listeria kieliensis]
MMQISKMPNLGKVNEEKLNLAGIMTAEELVSVGTETAYLKTKHLVDEGACLHFLYALEGAICNIPKKEIPIERKEKLKNFYQENQ